MLCSEVRSRRDELRACGTPEEVVTVLPGGQLHYFVVSVDRWVTDFPHIAEDAKGIQDSLFGAPDNLTKIGRELYIETEIRLFQLPPCFTQALLEERMGGRTMRTATQILSAEFIRAKMLLTSSEVRDHCTIRAQNCLARLDAKPDHKYGLLEFVFFEAFRYVK